MYGLVNLGVKDLVIKITNEETWNHLCVEAKVPTDYVSMEYYPDEITYKLVGVVSKKLNLSPQQVLGEFGKFWVHYTAAEGYGPLMDLFGQDYKSCLRNLNQLHMRMGMTMPDLTPPSFVYREISDSEIELEYQSKREGLSPMVEGLLHGLSQKYKVNAEISFREEESRKIFSIKIAS